MRLSSPPFQQSEDRDRAVITRPYNNNGWNLMHGITRVPSATSRAFYEIERFPDNMDIVMDKVSFTKMTCDPNELLLNGEYYNAFNLLLRNMIFLNGILFHSSLNHTGDLETGNSKYFDTWGGSTELDIVTGYGGVGSALRAYTRPHLSHGPAQVINTDCAGGGTTRFAYHPLISLLPSQQMFTLLFLI